MVCIALFHFVSIYIPIWSHFNSLEKIYEIYNLKGGPIFGGLTPAYQLKLLVLYTTLSLLETIPYMSVLNQDY